MSRSAAERPASGTGRNGGLGCLVGILLALLTLLFFAGSYGDPGVVYEPTSREGSAACSGG